MPGFSNLLITRIGHPLTWGCVYHSTTRAFIRLTNLFRCNKFE